MVVTLAPSSKHVDYSYESPWVVYPSRADVIYKSPLPRIIHGFFKLFRVRVVVFSRKGWARILSREDESFLNNF